MVPSLHEQIDWRGAGLHQDLDLGADFSFLNTKSVAASISSSLNLGSSPD